MEIIALTIGFTMLLILIPFYSSSIVGLAGVIIGGIVGVSVVRIGMKDTGIERERFWPMIQLTGGIINALIGGFIISQIQ